jgi:DNA-binding GntR family transcriptional regulator
MFAVVKGPVSQMDYPHAVYVPLHGLERVSLADQAYQALRSAVMAGELGPGDRITERLLAERLGISPTPVREALRRLEQDGLLERPGPRTIRVANFDSLTATGVLLAVARLRALAARLASTCATLDQLAQMAECLDEAEAERAALRQWTPTAEGAVSAASVEEALARGSTRIQGLLHEFHLLVYEAAGNAVRSQLLRTAEGVAGAGGVTGPFGRPRFHGPQERYDQHRGILDAIVARDGQGAEDLMADHLRYAGELRG